MKNAKKKAVGLLMTAALLVNALLQTGCNTREAKDIEEIRNVTEQFVETFATGNTKDMKDLVDGKFSYYFSTDNKDLAEVIFKFASQARIEDYKSVEVDRRELKAKARFKISYIDMYEFSKDMEYTYMSKADYLNEIDDYEDRDIANLTFNYIFDEDEGRWLIKEASAEKYSELYGSYWAVNISSISAEEAKAGFNGIIDGLALGNLDQPLYTFDLADVRIFDESDIDNPVINEAAEEFVKAYYSYVRDHGYSVDIPDDYPYRALISGSVPSKEAILDYFSSDERVIELCMAVIRSQYITGSLNQEDIWDQYYAGFYYDIAKQIPFMEEEEYVVIFQVNPGSSNPMIYTDDMVFPIYPDEADRAFHISDEQYLKCLQKAAESLYLAGEITRQQYDEILKEIDNTRNDINFQQSNNDYITWEGTANCYNQAVNTYEYVPDWSDGTLVYGISDVDRQGVYMFYSKEPGWLNTAGYNLSYNNINILLKYDHIFAKGTTLIYDWYVNGDKYGDSITFTVEEDGTTEFVLTMPDKEIPRYGTVELRLWEENHSHVIAYVTLTQT